MMLLLFAACESKVYVPTESAVSGTVMEFGMTGGWCAPSVFYRLTETTLLSGNVKGCYNGEVISYGSDALPDSSYQRVKELRTYFPAELTDKPNSTWGCPNCYDQGTIWVMSTHNGVKTNWKLDPRATDLPQDVILFIEKFNWTIARL